VFSISGSPLAEWWSSISNGFLNHHTSSYNLLCHNHHLQNMCTQQRHVQPGCLKKRKGTIMVPPQSFTAKNCNINLYDSFRKLNCDSCYQCIFQIIIFLLAWQIIADNFFVFEQWRMNVVSIFRVTNDLRLGTYWSWQARVSDPRSPTPRTAIQIAKVSDVYARYNLDSKRMMLDERGLGDCPF